jgi:transposase InsO family protein
LGKEAVACAADAASEPRVARAQHGERDPRAAPAAAQEPTPTEVGAKPIFRTLFREVGLPDAIRTDNGTPFASTGIHGLAALNVWWMQLGIVHQRITPASPQDNGTHARMHRELKRETARPAAGRLRAQQWRFDAFCQRHNDERPHEGIGDRTPSALWRPSSRPSPEQRTHPEYPSHLEIRRVSTAGTFRLLSRQPFLSHALSGEDKDVAELSLTINPSVQSYRSMVSHNAVTSIEL